MTALIISLSALGVSAYSLTREGKQGEQGPPSNTGLTGLQGPQGIPGDNGSQGPPGKNGTFGMNTNFIMALDSLQGGNLTIRNFSVEGYMLEIVLGTSRRDSWRDAELMFVINSSHDRIYREYLPPSLFAEYEASDLLTDNGVFKRYYIRIEPGEYQIEVKWENVQMTMGIYEWI